MGYESDLHDELSFRAHRVAMDELVKGMATDPLTSKGNEIMENMQKQYGAEKGKKVFYASKNKGTISGVDGAHDADKLGEEYEKEKGEQTPESKEELSMLNKHGKPVNSEGTLKKVAKDGGDGRWGGRARDCMSKDALTNSILDKYETEKEKAGNMQPKGAKNIEKESNLGLGKDGRWGGRKK